MSLFLKEHPLSTTLLHYTSFKKNSCTHRLVESTSSKHEWPPRQMWWANCQCGHLHTLVYILSRQIYPGLCSEVRVLKILLPHFAFWGKIFVLCLRLRDSSFDEYLNKSLCLNLAHWVQRGHCPGTGGREEAQHQPGLHWLLCDLGQNMTSFPQFPHVWHEIGMCILKAPRTFL